MVIEFLVRDTIRDWRARCRLVNGIRSQPRDTGSSRAQERGHAASNSTDGSESYVNPSVPFSQGYLVHRNDMHVRLFAVCANGSSFARIVGVLE